MPCFQNATSRSCQGKAGVWLAPVIHSIEHSFACGAAHIAVHVLVHCSQAKVSNFGIPVFVEQNVLWLEVTVVDTIRMAVCKRRYDL